MMRRMASTQRGARREPAAAGIRLIPSRIALLVAGVLVLAGAGWALASGGGGSTPAPAPNGGSAAPGYTPQREVAVQTIPKSAPAP
jgi:hypothetical protein